MSDSSEKTVASRLAKLENELADTKRQLLHREQAWRAQLKIAKLVHESLLPRPVRHPRIDISTRYIPVDKVGGDYCQVLFLAENCCYVTLCDVTGHGIGPALLATRVSSAVRRMVQEGLPPAEIVQRLNEFIFENFQETELPLTFFAAKIDFLNCTITYSGAGHPGPLLIRSGSHDAVILQSQNMLVGVVENCMSDEPEHVESLNPGDRLVFYTDGLTEAANSSDELLGEAGLTDMVTDICVGDVFVAADCILKKVAEFCDGPAQDDITLIVVEIK